MTAGAGIPPERALRPQPRGRNVLSGALFGVGAMSFVDEAVFHQLLHWHHFYDRSTPDVGLVSDGIFHAFGWFATVAGLFLAADLRRRDSFLRARWWGAVLSGAGAFQLFDGTVQHKLLGLHQIRYDVDLLPYDLAWNLSAAALLAAGLLILLRTRAGRRAGQGTDGTRAGRKLPRGQRPETGQPGGS